LGRSGTLLSHHRYNNYIAQNRCWAARPDHFTPVLTKNRLTTCNFPALPVMETCRKGEIVTIFGSYRGDGVAERGRSS